MPNRINYKRNGAWIPAALALTLAVGFMTGLKTGSHSDVSLVSIDKNKSLASHKVDEVLGFISQRYVDSIDVNALAEAAIQMIVDSLDPHSHYLDAASVAAYQAKMDGHYVGLGIEFRILKDTIVITEVLDESPAMKSGLQRGDQLLIVNDDTLSGIDLPIETIYSKLKGEKGSTAHIQYRRCETDTLMAHVKRARVNTKSVPFVYPLTDETVYIMINQFNANTSKEFLDALEPFHEEGHLKNLVIDLRQNPGGYLQEAVKILNQFFDKKGELLVYTEGMHSEKAEYKTAGKPYLQLDDIYILIDEESASASEIVAGAIQDLDRGTVVGRRSFGKGLVQEQYDLSHGGSLKLTVAKYYTPSGRLIQREVSNNEAYGEDFINRSNSGEWLAAKDIPMPDSTQYYSPGGKRLYGGRGIVPDIFVPMDSSLLSSRAYDLYFLREELGFLISRLMRCDGLDLATVEAAIYSNEWMDYLNTLSDEDIIPLIGELTPAETLYFRTALIDILNRYEGGMMAYYKSIMKHDEYIEAVKTDLALKTLVPLTTKNE